MSRAALGAGVLAGLLALTAGLYAGYRLLQTGATEDAGSTVLLSTEFADLNGQPVTLKRWAGQRLVVNFWATWCAPCKVEMPALDRLAGELGGKDFAVITISIDRGGAPVAGAFLEEIEARNLTLYVDPASSVSRSLRVQGLPVTILADADGREIARYLGPAEWDGDEAKGLISEAIRRER